MTDDSTYSLLRKIDNPADLRQLPEEKLAEVCKELRRDIIDEVSHNPGHFAASLGVVELTVALHYVFNTPYDKLVWDVGHQAYGHKILTGRRDSFCTNRKLGGICPFPTPKESEYDSCVCGHASNSISIALGIAVAARKEHRDDPAVQARDRKKEAICREHGFELIRVENSYARRYHYIKDILIRYFGGR